MFDKDIKRLVGETTMSMVEINWGSNHMFNE